MRDREIVLVDELDQTSLCEWHRRPAVQGRAPAEDERLLWLDRHGEECRGVAVGQAVADAEKVAERNEDSRLLLVIPGDPKEHLAVIVGIGCLPVEAQRVVDLEDRRGRGGVAWVEQSRSEQLSTELRHPNVSDLARAFE